MGALKTFPVSYRVSGRRILVVGGGEAALNKARLAARTEAEVLVVASEPAEDFTSLSVTLARRPFTASDLDGAALVFVADDGPDGRAAIAEARARAIPLNVVDRPAECDFYTPAIVDRAPLTIAVSSEGEAPVLARLVRARIEALLAPELGALARLAGAVRERVARLLPAGPAQRRFFEQLVTDPAIEAALAAGGGEAEADDLLARHVAEIPHVAGAGFVTLVGAGPGAADLLTLRAQRALQEADVIVHDRLVPAAVIDMGRRDAERIAVGKARGHHSFSQAQINTLLVRLARRGKRVVRLKGGDPMVFGRAAEELSALRRAGIAYAIVPGISAALAAAADTATPLTERRVSSGVVFATAHGAGDAELSHWAALAGAGLTLALYMGKSVAVEAARRLIGHGVSPNTPAGVIVNAGRPGRALYRGTLGQLPLAAEAFAEGPAIILIGETVAAGDWSGAEALADEQFMVA